MAFERREFQEFLSGRAIRDVQRRESELRQMAQAELPVKAVTQSAEWDYLLGLIQAKIEELGKTLDALQASQVSDPSFAHEDLAQKKALIIQVATQKDTLERVRDLPAEIFAQGEKAQLALRKLAES
jgi:hypothetical protein